MGKICQIIVTGIKGERKMIDVANSEDEFNKTTILAFKEKLALKCPELKDSKLRVMFTNNPLEDTDTFLMHKIEHLSTIFVIVQLPGGAACTGARREESPGHLHSRPGLNLRTETLNHVCLLEKFWSSL